jgi:hypothetical protein
MKATVKTIFLFACSVILLACATVTASPAGDGIKTVDVPTGGHIMFGPLAGQLTPQAAIGKVLHVISQHCGDRPQITNIFKASNGDILAAFFNVTAKNQDGHKLAGLVIASAPKSGQAAAVLLYDDSDRFASSLNPMFKRLQQEISASPSALGPPTSSSSQSASPSGSASSLPAPTAPAAPLQTYRFPDGTGSIGLPAGWSVAFAQKADILAKGPSGEVLRFGLAMSIVDPRDPRSSALGPIRNGTGPGNFLAIPFGIDGATAFKEFSAQMAIKNRKPSNTLNIGNIQQVPTTGGGRIFLISGDVDTHDGQGPVYFVARVVMSAQLALGGWEMTIYQVNIPKQLYPQEANTIAHIYPSYNVNVGVMLGIIKTEIDEVNRITENFINWSNKLTESSDRTTAGFSDFLREQTVIRSTETGKHYRADDPAAQWLINSGRFEPVPLSQYIKGIDFD